MEELERLRSELQTKVGYLEAENSNLTDASHGTFEIRRRFYDVYKRNKGNTACKSQVCCSDVR